MLVQCSILLIPFLSVCALCTADSETGTRNADKKISLVESKLKRQNEVESVGNRGEEIDLSGIPNQIPSQPQNPQRPTIPQQPGQSPFFGNPYFPQYPGYNGYNGFGFPGPFQGYPQGFPQFQPQPQPQPGTQSTVPSTSGRSVIIQNNGKQFLVQPLETNQKIVQKNGKNYLLQPLPANDGLTVGFNPYSNYPVFNVPNSALTGLSPASAPVNGAAPAFNPASNAAFTGFSPTASLPQPFAPSPSAQQASALPSNAAKLVASADPSQRVIFSNGKRYVVEQIPFRNGQVDPYFSTAVGAFASQLAAQPASNPFAATSPNQNLADAYGRANAAGYGLYGYGKPFDISGVSSGLTGDRSIIKRHKYA